MLKYIGLIGGTLVIVYLLYENGIFVFSSKRAVKFIGRRRGKTASFTSCTGTVKRIVRVKDAVIYEFKLYLELENGDVEIALIDSSKKELFVLDVNNTSEAVLLDSNAKYTLEVRFKSATGYYELDWE